MSLTKVLDDFKISVVQCEDLITDAHKTDSAGVPHFSAAGQQQVTVSAFLNMFIAWEGFLEASLAEMMIGTPTTSGASPIKYVSPLDLNAAHNLVIGTQRFFDYAKHENLKKLVLMYFADGYPFKNPIDSIDSDLLDLRTMRNAAAHISSTTQTGLRSLAQRLLRNLKPNITLYELLMAVDPRSGISETIFITYKNKLLVTAELISQG